MTDQLALIDPEPRPLTERQNQALQHLQNAGHEGLTPLELGQHLYGDRPEAKSWGGSVLQALRKRGLAVERRKPYRRWVALTEPEPSPRDDPGSLSADHPPDGLPVYGSLPKHF